MIHLTFVKISKHTADQKETVSDADSGRNLRRLVSRDEAARITVETEEERREAEEREERLDRANRVRRELRILEINDELDRQNRIAFNAEATLAHLRIALSEAEIAVQSAQEHILRLEEEKQDICDHRWRRGEDRSVEVCGKCNALREVQLNGGARR